MMRLKRFNKKRKLRQLHFKNNRETLIKKRSVILSIFIVAATIMYVTFARFESSNSFSITNSKVGDFSGDFKIVSYVYDGEKHDAPPSRNYGYHAKKVECTNASGEWLDYDWSLKISNVTGKVKCNVEFYQLFVDRGSNASVPELYEGLIPVIIDDKGETKGTIRVADPSTSWYDYFNNKWANAVTVVESARNKQVGDIITQDEIYQMFVWIPRYNYTLWNVANGTSQKQVINVSFTYKTSSKIMGEKNGELITHPAFTYGYKELNGFWVGKFEDSLAQNGHDIYIKPNVKSLDSMDASTISSNTKNIACNSDFGLNCDEVSTHVIKNIEWGAIAYLSSSVYGRYTYMKNCVTAGCDIWNNPNYNGLTGYSGSTVDAKNEAGYPWDNQTYGGNSSTTGNVYGVYDMSGGLWEFTMGNVSPTSSMKFTKGGSRLSSIGWEEYDIYSNTVGSYNFIAGRLGDATRETIESFDNGQASAWGKSYSLFPYQKDFPWFVRGGKYSIGTMNSIFCFRDCSGDQDSEVTSRVVLIKKK